jgi:hypothetical protein
MIQQLERAAMDSEVFENRIEAIFKSGVFFAWCVKRFQLQQIPICSPEPMTPYSDYSMSEAVGCF